MSNSNIIYDGNFDNPQPVNPVKLSYPVEGFTPLRQYSQDYVQLAGKYTAPIMGQPHPTYADAFLCHQSGFDNLGGGLVQFTWHYMTTPDVTFTEPIRISATFPEVRQQYEYEGQLLTVQSAIKPEYTKQTTGKRVTRFFMLQSAVEFRAGMAVSYRGRTTTIKRVYKTEEGETRYILFRSNASVSASQLQPIGELNTEAYENIPIENKFEATVRLTFYREKTWGQHDYEKYYKTIRVNYLSNLTNPSVDEYFGRDFVLAEETELEQVLGAVWSASEYLVRPQ
jgi:hypothetical protein